MITTAHAADQDPSVTLVCSARPRPSVQAGRSNGRHWWARDVHHIKGPRAGRTRCGLDCAGYLTIGTVALDEARNDANLCRSCHKKTNPGVRP